MQRTPRTTEVHTVPEQQPGVAAATPVAQPGLTETERGWQYGARPELEQHVTVANPRDRIRWGPVIGGLLTALTTFVALSILGAAIGATTLAANGANNANEGHYDVAAGIWTALSALIAFFLGGYVAAKTTAVGGEGNGWINGMMVFLAALPLIVWLASQGAANLFGAFGNTIYDLRNLVTNTYSDAAARQNAVDNAKNGLWWSLVALIAGIVASGLGGLAGHRRPREVWNDAMGTRP
jgi:hypothetical protein